MTRAFGNRIQSNTIKSNRMIEFDWFGNRTKSNSENTVNSIEFGFWTILNNRTDQNQSNNRIWSLLHLCWTKACSVGKGSTFWTDSRSEWPKGCSQDWREGRSSGCRARKTEVWQWPRHHNPAWRNSVLVDYTRSLLFAFGCANKDFFKLLN